MSFKQVQAAMASGLGGDETKPRRFDLSMSRRTRRPAPAAATLATSCNEQDHLQSRQPELDAHQEHETSEQCSQDTTKEQASPPQTRRLQKKDDESEEEEEYQDNSRRFSLQELIEDEAVDGVKDGGTEDNTAAAAAVRDVAEGTAAAEKRTEQVPGRRRVIGMMRRYVKVRSIKPKRAAPEKNATLVC